MILIILKSNYGHEFMLNSYGVYRYQIQYRLKTLEPYWSMCKA
jgi:hypothetical protein